MSNLLVIDRQNYDPEWPRTVKESAKAIIFRDDKVAMMHSDAYGFYVFPGGGIEEEETAADSLIREVRDETGMTIDPRSIIVYGTATEIRKDTFIDGIFEERQHYLFCEVETEPNFKPYLDINEMIAGYKLSFVTLDEAIAANERDLKTGRTWMERTTHILKSLKDQRHEP
jgi:8-oxo-dGTP pyrophosphatase MutT (NUDIX family)